MVNARAKGARGEREFCEWLDKNFDLDERPTRNLEQVRSGGADIICDPFFFEVKRVEKLNLQKWWLQVCKAVRSSKQGSIPIVVFRQNNVEWEFLIPASMIGIKNGFIRLRTREFKEWVKINFWT